MKKNNELISHIERRISVADLVDADVIAFDDNGFYIIKPLYAVSKTFYQCEIVREGVGTIIT